MGRQITVFENYWPTPHVDPTKLVSAGDWVGLQNIFSCLVELDGRTSVTSGIAESWTQSSNGLRWVFKIRLGIRWSDGELMTTEQIVSSLNRSLNGTVHTKLSSYVTSIESGDLDQVVFNLKTLPANFLVNLGFVDQAIVHPKSYAKSKFSWSAPVSGAFQIVSMSNDRILLKRNLFYWNKFMPTQLIDDVTLIRAKGDATDIEVLKASGIDAFQTIPGQISGPDDFVGLKEKYDFFSGNIDFVSVFMFNPKKVENSQLNLDTRRMLLRLVQQSFWASEPDSPLRAIGLRPPGTAGALETKGFIDIISSFPNANLPLKLKVISKGKLSNGKFLRHLIEVLKGQKIDLQVTALDDLDYANQKRNSDYDLEVGMLGASESDPDSVWRYYNNYFFEKINEESILDSAQLETDPMKRNQFYISFEKDALMRALYIPLSSHKTYILTSKSVLLDPKQASDWGLQVFKLRYN